MRERFTVLRSTLKVISCQACCESLERTVQMESSPYPFPPYMVVFQFQLATQELEKGKTLIRKGIKPPTWRT